MGSGLVAPGFSSSTAGGATKLRKILNWHTDAL